VSRARGGMLGLGLGLLGLLSAIGCIGDPNQCQTPVWNGLFPEEAGKDCLNVNIGTQSVTGDAGACGLTSEDNACAACLKEQCCSEGAACVETTDPCTAAHPTEAYLALKTCATDPCANACPGLQ
jgi:hypothetical protein